MKPMRVTLLLLIAAITTQGATLSGTVKDSEGAVIAKAHVIVHWDSAGSNYLADNTGTKNDIVVTTDSKGQFSIVVPPGFYDLFVTAVAFTPHCEKIRLKDKESKTYEVKLKVSPVTAKELD
jgi:uncharacterized GH25 family protein